MTNSQLETKVSGLPGGQEFIDSVNSLTPEELEKRIVEMQKSLRDSEEHKESNEELRTARELVSELSGPYNDFKKAVGLKTKYILKLLVEQGEG